jgi:uncharacterized membrane protein YdfJ with MMPL/SSD domain
MEKLTLALAAQLLRRRKVVLSLWIGVLLIAAPFAAQQSKHLTGGGFSDPASQSSAVQRDLAGFARDNGASLAVVLVARADARPGDMARAVAYGAREVAKLRNVQVSAESRLAAERSALQRPDRPTVIQFTVSRGGDDQATDVADKLRTAFDLTESHAGHVGDNRVDVYLGGQGALWAALQGDSKKGIEVSEIRAFPLTAIVLLIVFGSVAAAALPLSLGAAAVVLSGALIYLLSLAMQMSVFVTSVASMLGLGVAIDYSLFILVRYREEIAAGADAQDAIASALSTSGVAVAYSGLTVIAALAGLLLIDSTALRSIAIGAILVVAVSVLAASTLLPVLIRVLGRRAHEPGRLTKAFRRRRGRPRRTSFWPRWTAAVMRRPLLSVVAAAAVLLVLGIPALSMHIENTGLRQVGKGDPFRYGSAAAATVIGPGGLGPVQIVVATGAADAKDVVSATAVSRVGAAVSEDPLVRSVAPPRLSRDRRAALLVATLRSDPTSQGARAAIRRLRARLPAVAGEGSVVRVGGTTAEVIDFDHLVNSTLWKLALLVLVLSYVALVPLLRSVVLPLKAVLTTMLSVIAGYGVVVAIFQWGWLSFLGLSQAPYIDTVTPPLVLVVAFGLSMDYEVFMLSRIRERFLATGDTRQAVAEGLMGTARTITSAALIMVVVFLAFVSAGLPDVQRLGVACAAAIALDATLVRLVIVPGAMVLLDRWNWWLPSPLERFLPSTGRKPGQAGADEPEPLSERRPLMPSR